MAAAWKDTALKFRRSSPPWPSYREQKEAWMRQIREVQTWKQVRGPAGAVMCETRDLGTKMAALAHIDFQRG